MPNSDEPRLGVMYGGKLPLRRALILAPPSSLSASNLSSLAKAGPKIVEVALSEAETGVGVAFMPADRQVLGGFVSMALRAAGTHPHVMRAFCRLYSAGIEQDPAFLDPKQTEIPNALAGMGVEQFLPTLVEAAQKGSGVLQRWNRLLLALAILEGRIRPMGHSVGFMVQILAGAAPDAPALGGLAEWHIRLETAFFREAPRHYRDRAAKPFSRKEPVLLDFASSRDVIRNAAPNGVLKPEERAALIVFAKMLHPETLPLEDQSSKSELNFEHLRHAVAHMNFSFEDARTFLNRGSVMSRFLRGELHTKLSAISDSDMEENTVNVLRLHALSWAWQVALNILDVWLSAKVMSDVPFPQKDGRVDRVPGSSNRAVTLMAALAASGA